MTDKLRQAAQQAIATLYAWAPTAPAVKRMRREAIAALDEAMAEPAEVREPVAWEYRWKDTSPFSATSGQWTEWRRVEARSRLSTVEDAVREFQQYIADGLHYELRSLYTTPQPTQPQAVNQADRPFIVRLAEDFAEDCVTAGYVTTKAASYGRLMNEALSTQAQAGAVPLTDEAARKQGDTP